MYALACTSRVSIVFVSPDSHTASSPSSMAVDTRTGGLWVASTGHLLSAPSGGVSPVTWHQCHRTSVEPKPEQDIESLVPRRTQPIGQAFVDFICRVSSST